MSRAGVGILIDSGRLMCCDLLVGRGAESFFGCHALFDVRFDWQGIKRSLVEQ